MEDLELRKNYLDYFEKECNLFDLEKFITDNNLRIDNGAIGLITPNEILFVRNLPLKKSNKPGSGSHDVTHDILTKVIYDLPLDNRIFLKDSPELEYYVERNFDIKNGQNIFIRMINEGYSVIHNRAICIEFPKSVTSKQIEFLQYLEDMYGKTLLSIGNNMVKNGEDSLVYFKKNNRESVFCNSFKEAIEYAKENLVDEKKVVIEEKYIIGMTLEDIKNKDKKI